MMDKMGRTNQASVQRWVTDTTGTIGPPEASDGTRSVLGGRLRSWRRERGLPLKCISITLGVSISTVAAWETGRRFPGDVNRAALQQFTGMGLV